MYKGNIPLIRFTLEDNGFREATNSNQEWCLLWGVCNLRAEVYQSLKKYQKVNHFPRSIEITRKDCLCKNIRRMQNLYGNRHFDFVPKTFILPQEFSLLADEAEKMPGKFWIIKPAASSQGKGIFVTNNVTEIPTKGELIASKYIENPLLIDGYKFDLRIYLAITSIEPLRLYIYDEGLVRFATCKYSPPLMSNKNNRFIHLTNYSVNKYNMNFVPNNDPSTDGIGSKWSLSALKKYFDAHGINNETLWTRVDEIIIKTILSIEPALKHAFDMYVPFRNNCFELLGFDILIDNLLNPWLLEVNLSPSLNCDSPIDQKIKGEAIADLFTMIGIVPLDQRNYTNHKQKSETAKFNPYVANGGVRTVKLKKQNGGKKTLSKEEKVVFRDTEAEYKRRGQFRRIFPTLNYAYYRAFFEEERPLNALLAGYLQAKSIGKDKAVVPNIPKKVISKVKRVILND